MSEAQDRWQKLWDHTSWLENEVRGFSKRETATNLEAAFKFLEEVLRDFPEPTSPTADSEGYAVYRMAVWLLRALAEEMD